jgi:LmbE family N-acetylglucosaminyl deacetylase
MINISTQRAFPENTQGPHTTPTLDRWRAAATPATLRSLLGLVQSLGVIVPHADDETLGAGGLIAAASDLGISVTVTILTDGAASHPGSLDWPPARLARRRRHEVRAAVASLTNGTGVVAFCDAPDGMLADYPATADSVRDAEAYATCWRDDPHPDHQASFAIAEAVAKRRGAPLLAFPIWALDTDLPVPDLPVLQLDVTPFMVRKQRALSAHASQLGKLVADVPGFILDEPLQRLFLRSDELFVRIH